MESIRLNVALLRKRVPNLTSAAKSIGLRAATVSNLCTGKIPLARAEVRTLVALAQLANCSVDDLILTDQKGIKIETGIKAIDLFAPLVKNSTVGLLARPGMGQLALLAEVFHRLKKQKYQTILLKPNQEDPGLVDLANKARWITRTVDETVQSFEGYCLNKDVLLVVDRAHFVSGDLERIVQDERTEAVSSLTTFLMDLTGGALDDELPFGPLDTIWQFDPELVAKKHYPAIHPLNSISENYPLEEKENRIQLEARKTLRRYRELRSLYAIRGYEFLPYKEQIDYARGERLEAFLTQPFFIAEPYTERKGRSLESDAIFAQIQDILRGDHDQTEIEKLLYIGGIKKFV